MGSGLAFCLFNECKLHAPYVLFDCIEIDTIKAMPYIVEQTEVFAQWLHALRDLCARFAIARRIDRVQAGNLGDAKSVGGGVSEMRVDVGPGYRLYDTVRDRQVVFLLVGGNKKTQSSDIAKAMRLSQEI